MKTRWLVLVATWVWAAAQLLAVHRFVCVDNGANRLLHVDQAEPARNWSVAIPAGSRDLQLLANQRLLVSHGSGCGIYDLRDGRCLWKIEGFSGIQTARHLPQRDELLLGANARDGYEFHCLERDGKWFRRSDRVVRVRGIAPGLLRLARLTGDGHLLFTAGDPCRVIEWDMTAEKEVWSAPLPGKGYVAERCADGSTVATTGGAVSVVKMGRDGKILKTWLGDAWRKEHRLEWFSGFELLPNGDVVVANWLGHGAHGEGPHVIEVNDQNRVVWSWEDHTAAKQITNVLILDGKDPAAP